MGRPVTGQPPSKDGGEWQPPGKGPHLNPEMRTAYGFVQLHHLLWERDGIVVQELRISWIGDIWRLMIKGMRGRKHIISFFYADEWKDLLVATVTSVDSGYASWEHDKHPPYQYRAPSDSPTESLRPTF